MVFNIVSDIHLYYTPSFLNEVERVITKNTDIGTSEIVQEIVLFISRLNQGIYNLANQEIYDCNHSYSYKIDDIGTISFYTIQKYTGMCILINNIEWSFNDSQIYKNLTESAKRRNAILSLMERLENPHKRLPVK